MVEFLLRIFADGDRCCGVSDCNFCVCGCCDPFDVAAAAAVVIVVVVVVVVIVVIVVVVFFKYNDQKPTKKSFG